MSRAHRALSVFNRKIRLSDGSPRWRHLNFHETDAIISKDFWYLPRVLQSHAHHSIDFLCDNRIVAIQGNGEAGKLFQIAHLALSAHMVPVPGTTKAQQPWTDGGFRFGYRFSNETKGQAEEVQFSVMLDALTAMADAADRFSDWAAETRRNPVMRLREGTESPELAATKAI